MERILLYMGRARAYDFSMTAPSYRPVVTASGHRMSVTVMVGIHSAVIAWNAEKALVDDGVPSVGLLGFALRRTERRSSDDDIVSVEFVEGQKRFECDTDVGVDVRSDRAPFQRFRWSDYRLQPDHWYEYEVIPVFGRPCALEYGAGVKVKFSPSPTTVGGVGVFVNRGVTAAKAYQDRFAGQLPDKAPGAFSWLSRGLEESLIDFITSAAAGDELRVGIYEFHHPPIAAALKTAISQGASVRLVVHQRGDNASTESEHVLRAAGLWSKVKPRTHTQKLSHNKFVVLRRGGTPIRLWTGSANFSSNAFYLQTNQALVFDDPVLAHAYDEYWQILADDPVSGSKDPNGAQLRIEALMAATPATPDRALYFSPVRKELILDTAVELITNARSCVLMSAPFGTVKRVVTALQDNHPDVVEYGLVNTTAVKTIEGFVGQRNTQFFPPSRLETWQGRAWDAKAFGDHKIHAKSLIIDPWSDRPTVFVGSANFSRPSCVDNDENALLIRGDHRLSAILATEFMRMFDHYKSRGFIKRLSSEGPSPEYHLEDTKAWAHTAFTSTANSHKYRDRQVFAGEP